MAAPQTEAALPDVVASPPPPPVSQSPKYPAMMQSGGAVLAVVDDPNQPAPAPTSDLGPLAPPPFLVPPSVQSAQDVERKVESFDAAFAPLRNLTADDVVVGCFGTRRGLHGRVAGSPKEVQGPRGERGPEPGRGGRRGVARGRRSVTCRSRAPRAPSGCRCTPRRRWRASRLR